MCAFFFLACDKEGTGGMIEEKEDNVRKALRGGAGVKRVFVTDSVVNDDGSRQLREEEEEEGGEREGLLTPDKMNVIVFDFNERVNYSDTESSKDFLIKEQKIMQLSEVVVIFEPCKGS
uniref:Lipoprotein n=1 Tax=Syphacia muris TaxID=451379 RepID=A0A0N5AVL5_9BILA